MKYYDPNNKKNILACPDCENDELTQVDTTSPHVHINPHLDSDVVNNMHKTFGAFAKHNPHFICEPCYQRYLDDLGWDSLLYEGSVYGLNPLEAMNSLPIHPLKKPEVNTLCNYPDKCGCGQCPDPNQLQFKLKGAARNNEDDSTIEGRLGRCFQLAGRRASFGVPFQRPSDPNPILVHGTIQGMGLSPLAHAWVEHSDGTVHEPTTDQTYPKEMFNAIFNPVEEKRYNQNELLNKITETGHWGPWHETKGRI
jgi:hypothetical protein